MHDPAPNGWLAFLVLLLTAAAGCAEAAVAPSAICDVRVERHEVSPTSYERVDLLFVLDDSPSMAQERRHFLEVQLPRVAQQLLAADTPGRLGRPSNLHVGVISSDMGAGSDGMVDGCSASGDDGRLLNAGKCQTSEPAFAWYYEGKHDRDATAAAIECLADVGNAGCQVSQPLEAALKALWPAGSANALTGLPLASQEFRFLGDGPGHGLDANARFLRSQSLPSLLLVIILTDQDDCSTHDLTTFESDSRGVAAAVSCMRDPDKLRAIQTYVSGLQSLRPGFEQLLNVGIIAGVPPEWVSAVLEPARESVVSAPLLRDAFDALLTDPRMQTDPNDVVPSCSSAIATATAPRRLMQLARDLGPAAYVQSICDYDLADMLEQMLEFIPVRSSGSEAFCTHMAAVPDARGLLPCRITWELPEHADSEEPLTPVSCAERPDMLGEPGPGFPTRSERGRVLCEMRQAPVQVTADGSRQPQGEGFFHVPGERCPWRGGQRIAFTEQAKIPPGVTARIECLDPTQRSPATLPGGAAIGDACLESTNLRSSDQLCGNAAGDHGPGKLFCSPQTNRCVLGCQQDAQCPQDWECDPSSRTCIRPGCE